MVLKKGFAEQAVDYTGPDSGITFLVMWGPHGSRRWAAKGFTDEGAARKFFERLPVNSQAELLHVAGNSHQTVAKKTPPVPKLFS